MTTRTCRCLLACTTLTALVSLGLLFGWGPLTPPAGVVAATAKPLSEVEPRIAINLANTPGDATSIFRIAAPGSYYLTGNVTGATSKSGIKVAASNVTIDLCGFTVTGVAASHDGIQGTSGMSNVSVYNGHLTGWGSWGIDLDNVTGCRIRDVNCASNLDGGIRTDTRATIENCICINNDGEGIRVNGSGIVRHCICNNNTQNGVYIIGGAAGGGVIEGCTTHGNTSAGVRVGTYCVVTHNTCNQNGNVGIGLGSSCIITGNTCNSNVTDGIQCLAGNNSRIEDNTTNNNTRGIFVGGTRCFIVRNTASNNGAAGAGDFVFAAPNVYGQINDFTAGAILTANPWTNIKN